MNYNQPSDQLDFDPENPQQVVVKKASTTATVVSSLALVATAGIFATGYWFYPQWLQIQKEQERQANEDYQQKSEVSSLRDSIQNRYDDQQASLNKSHELSAKLSAELEQAQKNQQKLEDQLMLVKTNNNKLEEQLTQLNIKNAKHWRLNEAEYLIRLAGRKIWLEHDIVAATQLLRESDNSVQQLNDPRLLPLRKNIARDIATLENTALVDASGIVLKIDGIINELDKLKIAHVELPKPLQRTEADVSTVQAEWKKNLAKVWTELTTNFFTIRRRDGQVEALLEPKHAWYLRENLKLQLQQAQFAVLHEDPKAFTMNLTQANAWLNEYYQKTNAMVRLSNKLNEIVKLPVTIKYPKSLTSINGVEKALKERRERLLKLHTQAPKKVAKKTTKKSK